MTSAHKDRMSKAGRLAVIGAGPLGIECALYASRLGHDVQVYEAGEIAQHLGEWGHIRMFSPWSMNVSALGKSVLASGGTLGHLFRSDRCPTGHELREQYLLPLAASSPLNGRIHTQSRVLGISRDHLLKGDQLGSTARSGKPFRLLIAPRGGKEKVVKADRVIDISGVFSQHNWLGSGGLPAPGERALASRIDYGLPDISAVRSERFAGKRTLVIGSGLSAVTSVAALADLARRVRGTSVLWLVRSEDRNPYESIPGDPLIERAKLMQQASGLMNGAASGVKCRRGWVVEEAREAGEGFEITLSRRSEVVREQVDRVIANVGYRPDRSLYEELQVHECYATQGPMRLAAALLGEGSADCLGQTSHGADSLRNPEPDFFILGAKSYGRNPHFLLTVGHAQIRDAFRAIESDENLDLYAAEAA